MINGLVISILTQAEIRGASLVFETTIPDAFNNEGLGHRQEDIHREIAHKKQLLKSSLDKSNYPLCFMIAILNGTVIGTISFGSCGEDIKKCTENQLNDIGELGSLFILPPYQGQGVGSELINTMLKHLSKQGIEWFCLDSGYKNAQKRWLRKFGEPHKVVKDYWGSNYDHMIWLCRVKP
ncbi:acetyltransferase (GNAT) family protein [Desulfosporosinus acididurans]|uniref:Acetyltransferase (GNAT) family protein n=1 Tax=Desulfosporosinus acididurans TaxID=476652 RepID=A0A0J1FLK5_9FIRM|nr:GNAT family N-acetyltransferase [Desulfosporosinus acididurans]KLU64247.1 acetyltransferase (GNAT) family protein [Desulfosporosinus acididurans]